MSWCVATKQNRCARSWRRTAVLLEHDVVAARGHAEAAAHGAHVSMPLAQAEWARWVASNKDLFKSG